MSDNANNLLIIFLLFILMVSVGSYIYGYGSSRDHLLQNYCEFNNSVYIKIDDIHYCNTENQLTSIDWAS